VLTRHGVSSRDQRTTPRRRTGRHTSKTSALFADAARENVSCLLSALAESSILLQGVVVRNAAAHCSQTARVRSFRCRTRQCTPAIACPFFLNSFFTARRHASVVYAIRSCVSVCPSQVGVLLKRLNVESCK